MDSTISIWLNDAAQHPVLRQLSVFGAKYLVFVMVALVAAVGIRAVWRGDARAVALLLIAGVGTALALLANVGATSWWYRARPYNSIASVHALVARNPESGFYSDHTVLATGCALAIVLVARRWGLLAAGLAAAVAVARVAVGAHHPTDVLAAAAVVTIITLALLPSAGFLTRPVELVLDKLGLSRQGPTGDPPASVDGVTEPRGTQERSAAERGA